MSTKLIKQSLNILLFAFLFVVFVPPLVKTIQTIHEIKSQQHTATLTASPTNVSTSSQSFNVDPDINDLLNTTYLETGPTELECLTEAVYFEARGESANGQKAVANVVMNRVESKYFPNTICEVVNQPYQFSYTLDRYKITDTNSWDKSKRIAQLVMNRDFDRTNGALYYYNPNKLSQRPKWASNKYYLTSIGNHRFYSWHKTI